MNMNQTKKTEEKNEVPAYPEAFLERMRGQLEDRYEAFLASTREAPVRGIRMNPLKKRGDGQSAAQEMPARMAGSGDAPGELLGKIPWAENGYELAAASKAGAGAFHAAGCYYLQEPSAMAPAQMLLDALKELQGSWAPERLPRVLDLCAAPGGKSTQLAAGLAGRGILVSNEIHPARAKILSENMERMGAAGALVVSASPDELADRLEGFFDAVLVDAPCSGEGMFRRDPEARAQWSPENVTMCAQRQDGILGCAARMLRPGGVMVYSTCTFAPEEDEGSIERFLSRHPDLSCCEQKRLWPMDLRGEGHFAALLTKNGDPDAPAAHPIGGYERGIGIPVSKNTSKKNAGKGGQGEPAEKLWETFLGKELVCDTLVTSSSRLRLFGENLWLMPEETPSLAGLRVLRCGLQLGSIRKDRFEPAHALALALSPAEALRSADLTDGQAQRYLHGESLPLPDAPDGWTLACMSGYSLGWGKVTGGILKNHYPKGLRT